MSERAKRSSRRKLFTYYPDAGPRRRELYPKHLEFFRLGREFNERALIAGNRTGKTFAAAYEVALHLTGLYPEWWPGYRFTRATRWWVAGKSYGDTRDILQTYLLGPDGHHGEGMIPAECLESTSPRAGVAHAVESATVMHVSGKRSLLQFKSYEQGRESFQGTEQDGIWFDEECPDDVYGEALIRTMTTKGMVLLTFTPLKGITPLISSFLPEFQTPPEAV